jgi:cysteine-rich repeat protein
MMRPAPRLRLFSWGTACFGGLAFAIAACGARSSLYAPELVPDTCGDGSVEAGEECDDGNQVETDGCLPACLRASCGDGIRASFEGCDDGNDVGDDGCKSDCTLPKCGDGVVDPGEECDDPDLSACTPLCRLPVCGDGFVRPVVEECDLGGANEDRPAILLINDPLSTPVTPLQRSATAVAFYDYSSVSAHTGFEELHASRLFLYQETAAPGLSLFTFHGIDLDSTGQDEGDGAVQQTISGLPSGVFIALGDEPNELSLQSGGTAIGNWSYHHNTDGGVLGGIPFPGSWRIEVDSSFIASITSWDYVDGDGTMISLSLPTAILQAFDGPSACRTDCTVPRCGDGRLDGGEVCDDGGTTSGDGCAGDCKSTD